MIDLLSTVRFVPSYPQLVIPTSQTKFGGRVLSTVEYADRYRTVDMETLPMKASEAVQLQAFIAAAQGGMETIVYRPKHICIPRAYWGQPSGPNTNPGDVAAQGDFRTASYNVRGETVPQSTAMSFVRNSVATYFDSTGTMRTADVNEPRFDHDPAEVNYVWPSEDLTSSRWAKTRMSAELAHVWSGYQFTRVIPDTTLQTSHQVTQTNAMTFPALAFNTPVTITFVAKSDGDQTIQIQTRLYDSIGFIRYIGFNLLNGAATNNPDGIATMQSLGEGYWLITVSYNARATSTSTGIQLYAANPAAGNVTNFDFNGFDGYFLSAAQIDWGSVAKPYKKTVTGPVAKALGLLNEPTSTNINTNSGSLVGGYTNVDGVSIVSPSTEPAPLTSQFFAKIVEGTATASPRRQAAFSGAPAGAIVWSSIFVKAAERKRILFGNYSFVNWLSRSIIVLDTETGQFWLDGINPEGFVENCGGGIWRICIKGVLNADATSGQVAVGPRLDDATTNTGYLGDGVSGIYAWGFQIEVGVDRPTSYIPTTTAPVTRQADVATLYATGTNNWTLHSETGATQSLGNISGGPQLTPANLNSKYVRDYKAITVTPPPSPIEATATRGTVTNGYTVQLLNVTPGLELRDGDLISFKSGDYRQMVQIAYGGGAKAVSTQMVVKVDQPIASYIASGATVRFKQPEINTRLVKDSFQMTKGPRPTATFQLIEVPK